MKRIFPFLSTLVVIVAAPWHELPRADARGILYFHSAGVGSGQLYLSLLGGDPTEEVISHIRLASSTVSPDIFLCGGASNPLPGDLFTCKGNEFSTTHFDGIPPGALLPLGAVVDSAIDFATFSARLTSHDYVGVAGSGQRQLALIDTWTACDINGSGSCNLTDMDLLTGAIATNAPYAAANDVDRSGIVDAVDVEAWRTTAGLRKGLLSLLDGKPTQVLPGDANLDNRVQFSDFVDLANHYGAVVGRTWSQGNFDGDAVTNFSDFVILSNNYGKQVNGTAGIISVVPEPAGATSWQLVTIGLIVRNWLRSRRCKVHPSHRYR